MQTKTDSTVHAIDMTDEQLVESLKKTRNTIFFGVLYDRYAKKVFNKCLSFTKERAEAEDLVHDIFVKVHFKLHTFSFQSKFSTWLYAVTYNFCIDHQNRKKREQKVYDEYLVEHLYESDEPKDAELFEIQVDRLKVVLNYMTLDEKVLLLLKYQDGLSIKELMEVTDSTESAIKMRLKRSKTKLLKLYKDRYAHNVY